MPDLMQFLRLKNLFGQPPIDNNLPAFGGINEPQPMFGPKPDPYGNISFGPASPVAIPAMAQPAMAEPEFDVNQRMQELYSPETVATDRFNKLIDSAPKQADYKPSMLRRIGAGLIGGFSKNANLGQSVLMGPHTARMNDWRNQMGGAHQAATLERHSNANERQLAGTMLTQERLTNANQSTAANATARTKIMQDRAEVYRLKSLKGTFKFDFSGPKVLIADPATGKVETTDIDTGSLSDADKMALTQDNALEMEGVRQGGRTELEGMRQSGREGLAETRGWTAFNTGDGKTILVNQITGETKPITGVEGSLAKPGTNTAAGRGELPTQTKVRQATAAREFAARNPELGRFIQFSPGNEFSIRPPATTRFGTGPTAEQYKKITDSIYGGDVPIPQPGRTGSSTTVSNTPGKIRQKSPSTGKIRESSDGGKTWQIVN